MKISDYPKKCYAAGFEVEGKKVFDFYPKKTSAKGYDNVEYIRSDLIPKWHKYPDEKPEHMGYYLFQDDHTIPYVGWMTEDGCWYVGVDEDRFWGKITAWQELPEHYKIY